MKEFFKRELETLHAKTGIRQFENIMAKENWEEEIDNLINFMIAETQRDQFRLIKPEVIQRVIADAIITDHEFIGLNAKFVRRALNAWWGIYGDKVLMARDSERTGIPEVHLTEEERKRVDEKLNAFRMEILQGGGFKSVPKLKPDEISKEGAEWQSEIEMKSVSLGYKPMTIEEVRARELHIQYISENYNAITREKKPGWMPEPEWTKIRKNKS